MNPQTDQSSPVFPQKLEGFAWFSSGNRAPEKDGNRVYRRGLGKQCGSFTDKWNGHAPANSGSFRERLFKC